MHIQEAISLFIKSSVLFCRRQLRVYLCYTARPACILSARWIRECSLQSVSIWICLHLTTNLGHSYQQPRLLAAASCKHIRCVLTRQTSFNPQSPAFRRACRLSVSSGCCLSESDRHAVHFLPPLRFALIVDLPPGALGAASESNLIARYGSH